MFSWFCCNQNLLKSWCGLWARLWKKLPKICCRDLQVGILENWYHKKKKKLVWEKFQKQFCQLWFQVSHYQQVEGSRIVLLKITSNYACHGKTKIHSKEYHQSYEDKYMEVKDDIDEHLRRLEPFIAI